MLLVVFGVCGAHGELGRLLRAGGSIGGPVVDEDGPHSGSLLLLLLPIRKVVDLSQILPEQTFDIRQTYTLSLLFDLAVSGTR